MYIFRRKCNLFSIGYVDIIVIGIFCLIVGVNIWTNEFGIYKNKEDNKPDPNYNMNSNQNNEKEEIKTNQFK